MLTEFRLIRNVGKYENCSGAPTLKQTTLIYAENARGKTTLTSILRSLGGNDPRHITVRQRLGTTQRPEIRISSTDESHVFENGAWDTPFSNMLIFDDHFIEANVYSGMGIGRDQRIGLHEIILGEEGVTVARDLTNIKGEITSVNSQIRELEGDLSPHMHGLATTLFIALEDTPDAAAQISLKESQLAQIQQAEPIRNQGAFERIDIPEIIQVSVSDLFSLSLTDIDQNAIASVKRHFSDLGQQGEQWVQTGLSLADKRDACPFCDQDIQDSSQLGLYRAYFSDEYEQHLQSISNQSADLDQSMVDAIRSLREAAAAKPRWDFWDQYIEDLPPLPDYGVLAERSESLLELLREAFHEKAQSPLAQLNLSEPLIDAITEYSTARATFEGQQNAILLKNTKIADVKANAATGDRLQIESDIKRLRATIARHEERVAASVDNLLQQRQRKVTLDADKEAKRSQLDALRDARLPGFERSVNKYLSRFGADFEIVSVAPDNQGGAPCVRYRLKVNGMQVDIDRFKNTLSAGDRSTLALAYFFSTLEDHANLEEFAVVLDDPFTSMDKHRTNNTVQALRWLRTQVKQLVVLSHDGIFLWKIQELLSPADRETGLTTMTIARDSGWTSSRLLAWDVTQQERTLFDQWHEKLRNFRDGSGEASEVAPLLRMTMEAFCRVAFPESYPPGMLLGQFRNTEIQRREDKSQLLDDDDFRQLCDITDYANKFHHATNPNYEKELAEISENELKSYVDQVLEFTSY